MKAQQAGGGAGWTCDACMVKNADDAKICAACETPRPGFEEEAKAAQKAPAKPKAAKRKAPVKKVSTKRKRDASVYTRRKAEFFKAHPVCQFPGCKKPTSDLHHSRGRAGSLFLDERFWKALCRDHHNWVGENMDAAREMGLLCPKGKWNSPPTE